MDLRSIEMLFRWSWSGNDKSNLQLVLSEAESVSLKIVRDCERAHCSALEIDKEWNKICPKADLLLPVTHKYQSQRRMEREGGTKKNVSLR